VGDFKLANNLTIGDLLETVKENLAEASFIFNTSAESENILREVLRKSRVELYLDRDEPVAPEKTVFIKEIAKKRSQGEPLQYLLGHHSFRYLDLVIRKGVFIPRPETELLVEEALAYLAQLPEEALVIDIGTGCGAIALSIAFEQPKVKVIATDISSKAVKLARENLSRLGFKSRVSILQTDLLNGLERLCGQVDLIISNPPYIPTARLPSLPADVQSEPRSALDGGSDGLKFYKRIIQEAPHYLKVSGYIMLELGENQVDPVKNLLRGSGFSEVKILKDYQGTDRIITACLRKVIH
jgi:release factor glutamine methyltransferase